jgi:hypothetical protein
MDSVMKLQGFQWFETTKPDQSGGAHSLKPDPHRSVWSQVGNQGSMQKIVYCVYLFIGVLHYTSI